MIYTKEIIKGNESYIIPDNNNKNLTIIQENNKNLKDINNNSNPYLKAILFSFNAIDLIKNFFQDDSNFNYIKDKNNSLSELISKYIKCHDKNSPECKNIIKVIENKINEKDKTIFKYISFIKLINVILKQLHIELNKKKNLTNYKPIDDYDESMSYKNFKKSYLDNNDSFIQNNLSGVMEQIEFFQCCKLSKYNFNCFRCVEVTSEHLKKSNMLQNIISEMENKPIPKKKFCSMCYKESNILVNKIIYDSPEILIIAIENKNKSKLKYNKIIKTKKFEYNLLCCITETINGGNIFNVIYNYQNVFYGNKVNDNYENIEPSKIQSLSLNPCVLFYGKGKQIISNEIKNDILNNNVFTYNENNESRAQNTGAFGKNMIPYIINSNTNELPTYNDLNINGVTEYNDKDLKNNKSYNIHNYSNILSKNKKYHYNESTQNNLNINILTNEIITTNSHQKHNKNYNNKYKMLPLNESNNDELNKSKNPKNKTPIKQKNSNIDIKNYNDMNPEKYLNNNKNNNYNPQKEYISFKDPSKFSFQVNNVVNEKCITLYFEFSNGKQIYLDVNDTLKFEEVIEKLKNKYDWLNNIEIKDFLFNGKHISRSKTVKANGLVDSSKIIVIEP